MAEQIFKMERKTSSGLDTVYPVTHINAVNGFVDLIVDNLTTDSSAKILSANQGKVLKAAVDTKLSLTGGTLTGNVTFTNTNNTTMTGSTPLGLYGSTGTNDGWRIVGGGSENAGFLEIATNDDGNEPIYVRQYSGGGGYNGFATQARTLTLLDGSGNTSIPGTLTVAQLKASSTGGVLKLPANSGTLALTSDIPTKVGHALTLKDVDGSTKTYDGGTDIDLSSGVYNAAHLGGKSAATDATGDTIVLRNSMGDITARYLHLTAAPEESFDSPGYMYYSESGNSTIVRKVCFEKLCSSIVTKAGLSQSLVFKGTALQDLTKGGTQNAEATSSNYTASTQPANGAVYICNSLEYIWIGGSVSTGHLGCWEPLGITTVATTSSDGLMSKTDKSKLDHLPTVDGSIKPSWTWGTLLAGNGYTQKFTWDEAGGGSVAFAAKSGQTSMQIDGRYYDQDGKYALIDTNDLSTKLDDYSKTNHTHTISAITDLEKASVASAAYASSLGSTSGNYTYTTLNNKFAEYTPTSSLPKVIR